jgi:hypothetical protein
VTNRKNNSILFLTTLGVYLGLMLVGGAAPQVFAHGALTRQFDLQDEIEISDDLDNQPDGETALDAYASAVESIFVTSTEIADTVPFLVEQGRYDFDTYYGINAAGRFHGVSYLGKGVVSGKYSSPIRTLLDTFPHLSDSDATPLRLIFAVETQNFEFKTSFAQSSAQDAAGLAETYAALLPTLKERQASAARRLIYESTQITAKDNQLYIVTRLARSDLDALLAPRAK